MIGEAAVKWKAVGREGGGGVEEEGHTSIHSRNVIIVETSGNREVFRGYFLLCIFFFWGGGGGGGAAMRVRYAFEQMIENKAEEPGDCGQSVIGHRTARSVPEKWCAN